jgi:xanthine dehydrogenase accessory factor
MRAEVLALASELSRRGEPFVMAIVIARTAPISSQVGDTALVTREGRFHGWVGGSCTRPTVMAEAKRALSDGQPRLLIIGAEPRDREQALHFPMTCHSGGSVEIHLQPVLPRPRMLIYGMSPTARALSRLAQAMGYEVYACDENADDSAFPGAAMVATKTAQVVLDRASAPVFAVVATHGDWDEEAVTAALAHKPDYLGVVASPRRFAVMRSYLAERLPEASFALIKNPAGLDIGASGPEEIALSILAEIVKQRRAAAPGKIRLAQSAASARDPVCGMSVTVEGAQFRATHGGRDFYFCCAGCRDRFTAAPEHFVAAGAGP